MKKYDLLIIGSGPAGMNAAIYASRANVKTAIIEKGAPGGKLVYISSIENWIGETHINGADLALKMNDHVKANGVDSVYGDVAKIDSKNNKVILQDGEELEYKFLIIATGTSEVVPEKIEGIHKFNTKGVSYCAICDGPLYKEQIVGVIGGGNSAIEEACYLASIAKEVHVFVRNKISADKKLVDTIESKDNAFIHYKEEVVSLHGDEVLESITTTNNKYEMKALFPYIGQIPNSSFIEGTGIENNRGFIIVNENMQTNIKNIFAIGDVNDKHIRQISTAVSDGTIAAKIIANLI